MRFLATVGLLVATTAFGVGAVPKVLVRFSADIHGTRTNVWFLCHVLITNDTDVPLTVTNLFSLAPGLALKISYLDGKELARTYAVGLHAWTWTFAPHSEKTYKLMYGVPSTSGNYGNPGISLPGPTRRANLQIEGTLSGSSYSGRITSNIVEIQIP
jgi:hypothetical protein